MADSIRTSVYLLRRRVNEFELYDRKAAISNCTHGVSLWVFRRRLTVFAGNNGALRCARAADVDPGHSDDWPISSIYSLIASLNRVEDSLEFLDRSRGGTLLKGWTRRANDLGVRWPVSRPLVGELHVKASFDGLLA